MLQTELWKVLNLQYLGTGHEISPLNLSNEWCDFKLLVMTWQFKFVTNFGLIASAKK